MASTAPRDPGGPLPQRIARPEGGAVLVGPGREHRPFRAQTERRLVALMSARLGLTLLGFGIVLGLDAFGLSSPLGVTARRGLYWTLAFGFLATAVAGLSLGRVRNPMRFAAMQLAADLAVVTLLVHFSGGHESVFSFLYVAVTAYGALLFEPRSALAAATASALAYGAVLLVEQLGLGVEFSGGRDVVHAAVAIAHWGVHVGALFLVGALGSVVSSELRRTGAELDRSSDVNRRLRDLNAQIVRSLNSGLLTTDGTGRVGSFNPEAERITGWRARDVIGRPVDEVIPGAWELLTAPPGEGLEPVRRMRLGYRSRRGTDHHLGLAGSDLRDAAGVRTGHVLIFQDVTHVVEMETELTQRERLAAVGEMAARIAHEIRNPLAAISGSVQILSSDAERSGEEEPRRLMNIVVREADRLSGLITDFLGYARPCPPAREPVELWPLVSEVVEMLGASGAPDGIAIEVAGDSATRVLGDPGQLRQVLWNLFLNGVEAMPKGGALRITVSAGGAAPQGPSSPSRRAEQERAAPGPRGVSRYVEVAVEDEGEGIEPERLERLFEPFYTTKAGGTGLGLATVHRIVEAHDGELLVESQPGVGTRFRVRLAEDEGEA
jgi:two-component system sensor histidine kinase PilS (NtrC family)